MLTPASRLHLALSTFSLVAGVAYFFGSDYDLFGTLLFAGLLVVSMFLAVASVIHQDHKVPVDPAGIDAADLAPSPMVTPASPWPLIAAIGVGLAAVGFVEGIGYLAIGAGLVGVAVLEAAIQSWSEAISDDPAHNLATRNKVLLPLEVPIGATAAAAVVAIALSRLLLTVSVNGAVVAAGVISVVVLAIGTLFALKPEIPASAVTGTVVVCLIGVLAAGVFGAVNGERDFAHHGDEAHHGEGGDGHDAEGVTFNIEASDISFDTTEIEAAAGEITLTLVNNDEDIPHSIAIGLGDAEIASSDVVSGPATVSVSAELDEGSYTFFCEVHPSEMNGELVVSAAHGGDEDH